MWRDAAAGAFDLRSGLSRLLSRPRGDRDSGRRVSVYGLCRDSGERPPQRDSLLSLASSVPLESLARTPGSPRGGGGERGLARLEPLSGDGRRGYLS